MVFMKVIVTEKNYKSQEKTAEILWRPNEDEGFEN